MHYLEILLNLGHMLTIFNVHIPYVAWHYFLYDLGDFPNKFENLSQFICVIIIFKVILPRALI